MTETNKKKESEDVKMKMEMMEKISRTTTQAGRTTCRGTVYRNKTFIRRRKTQKWRMTMR